MAQANIQILKIRSLARLQNTLDVRPIQCVDNEQQFLDAFHSLRKRRKKDRLDEYMKVVVVEITELRAYDAAGDAQSRKLLFVGVLGRCTQSCGKSCDIRRDMINSIEHPARFVLTPEVVANVSVEIGLPSRNGAPGCADTSNRDYIGLR